MAFHPGNPSRAPSRSPPRSKPVWRWRCRLDLAGPVTAAKRSPEQFRRSPGFASPGHAVTGSASKGPLRARIERDCRVPEPTAQKISMRQNGPSARPCRGVSIREVHGVQMRPINTKPASVVGGIATETSAFRISFSRTISDSAFAVLDATICDHRQCR